MKERNAIITSAEITNDDHGCLSAWVHLDYGGSGQGFGGHALHLPKNFEHKDEQKNYCGHFIWRVMEIAGVSKWSNLKGKTIRVKSEHNGIEAIGHIIEDNWFCPKDEFEAMK